MTIAESIIMAVSLCADCFAVSLCSSVTIRHIDWKSVAKVALVFAFIQTGLFLAGWAFGNLFVGLVEKISHIIGFLLLLYVGGSMLLEGVSALKGKDEDARNLDGLKNVIIGGTATSIDALAVGVSQSMAGRTVSEIRSLYVSIALVTAISVVAGIFGGKTLGHRFGHWAEIAGGLVLVGIGTGILIN